MNIVFRYKRPQPYISSPLVAKLFYKKALPRNSNKKEVDITSTSALCIYVVISF